MLDTNVKNKNQRYHNFKFKNKIYVIDINKLREVASLLGYNVEDIKASDESLMNFFKTKHLLIEEFLEFVSKKS